LALRLMCGPGHSGPMTTLCYLHRDWTSYTPGFVYSLKMLPPFRRTVCAAVIPCGTDAHEDRTGAVQHPQKVGLCLATPAEADGGHFACLYLAAEGTAHTSISDPVKWRCSDITAPLQARLMKPDYAARRADSRPPSPPRLLTTRNTAQVFLSLSTRLKFVLLSLDSLC
jgi:hypothetical protein